MQKLKPTEKMSVLTEASLTPLLDLLSVKGGDTSGAAGSIVGHVTAEPSLAPSLCKKLGEQVCEVAVYKPEQQSAHRTQSIVS